jgi:hypothetical protein
LLWALHASAHVIAGAMAAALEVGVVSGPMRATQECDIAEILGIYNEGMWWTMRGIGRGGRALQARRRRRAGLMRLIIANNKKVKNCNISRVATHTLLKVSSPREWAEAAVLLARAPNNQLSQRPER